MALNPAPKSVNLTRDGYAYLTKRLVVSTAQAAGKIAALRAMNTMGYVVTLSGGWVVKKYKNGISERIVHIEI